MSEEVGQGASYHVVGVQEGQTDGLSRRDALRRIVSHRDEPSHGAKPNRSRRSPRRYCKGFPDVEGTRGQRLQHDTCPGALEVTVERLGQVDTVDFSVELSGSRAHRDVERASGGTGHAAHTA